MPTTLESAPIGDALRITAIEDPTIALMALRLGIQTGQVIVLSSRIPGGPSVIRRGSQEIALGREICRGIHATPAARVS